MSVIAFGVVMVVGTVVAFVVATVFSWQHPDDRKQKQ